MLRVAFASLTAMLALQAPAVAFYDLTKGCSTESARTEMFAAVKADLARVVAPIERVPPAEAEYLRQEMKDAFGPNGSKARFKLVYQNKFYPAFKVREDYDLMLKSVNAAENGWSRTGAIDDLLEALHYAGGLTGSITDYINEDGQRGPAMLSGDQIRNLSSDLVVARGTIRFAAGCLLDALRPEDITKLP